eukprot:COSAG01_NODE_52127_length_349_cov_0.616000_1_plen_80_part_01
MHEWSCAHGLLLRCCASASSALEASSRVETSAAEVDPQQLLNLTKVLRMQNLCIAPSQITGAGAGLYTTKDRHRLSRLSA